MQKTVASELAWRLVAMRNCKAGGNVEGQSKHRHAVEELVRERMPSGSGIDVGTAIDMDASHDKRLTFIVEYHHMDTNGYYDGWTTYTIRAYATFQGFDITIAGRDRNGVKDYLADVYREALSQVIA